MGIMIIVSPAIILWWLFVSRWLTWKKTLNVGTYNSKRGSGAMAARGTPNAEVLGSSPGCR